jgi:hypothetical protein
MGSVVVVTIRRPRCVCLEALDVLSDPTSDLFLPRSLVVGEELLLVVREVVLVQGEGKGF